MSINRPSGSNIEDNSIESSDIKDGTIVNADISASAQVVFSKMETLASNKIVITDASGVLIASNQSLDDLNENASLDSPTFTGIPTAPTAALGNNTTQLATTAFVQGLINQVNSGSYAPVLAGNGLSKTDQTLSINESITATRTYVNQSIDLGLDWTKETSGEIYVDQRFTGTSNGTIHKPYKSIQTAIQAAYGSGFNDVTILIKSGNDYTENLTIDRNLYGPATSTLIHLSIVCLQGGTDSTSVKINGTVTISGSLTTRVKLQNVQLAVTAGNTNALVITGTQGRHVFDNVSISGKVVINGSFENWMDFRRGSNAGVEISGTPVGNAAISFQDVLILGQVTQSVGIVSFVNCNRLYGITHTGGYLNVIRSVFSTTGLVSSANTGMLSLLDVSFFNGSAYTALNKSGSCYYVLSNVVRSGTDTINGTRFKLGASSSDLQFRPQTASHFMNQTELSVKSALDHLGSGVTSSDRALKTDIMDLSDAEQRVAKRLKKLIKTYRYVDDPSKIHVGVIAQHVEDAFLAEDLNPHAYAILDKQLVMVDNEEVSRYGVRYQELLAFIIAAI